MTKAASSAAAHHLESRDSSEKSRARRRRNINRRPFVVLFCYFFTITAFLQVQVARNNDGEPFLTHLDSAGGGGDGFASSSSSSSSSRGRNSCSKNAFRALDNLVKKIMEDQNRNSLIPLEIPAAGAADDGNDTITVPGLHLNFFRNKTIALLGDSTLFYMTKFIVSMIRHQDKVGRPVEYHKMKMWEATKFMHRNTQFRGRTFSKDLYRYGNDGGKTWFGWMGMNGNAHGKTEELMEAMFDEAEALRPEVLVVNMAFHWLHLCGYHEAHCPSTRDLPILSRWLLYEETFLQRSRDFAERIGARVLLYKTANLVCGGARTGDWRTGDDLYSRMDDATIAACVERLVPLARGLVGVASDDDIAKYCKYGQFTDVGSRYLNARMVEFVRTIQDDEHRDGDLIVGLYNDHDVEGCDTTDDGIHYQNAIPVRGRLLANTIDAYLKCYKGGRH